MNIEAQPLSSALVEFAAQTKLKIRYENKRYIGRWRGRAVQGTYTIAEEDTDVTYTMSKADELVFHIPRPIARS